MRVLLRDMGRDGAGDVVVDLGPQRLGSGKERRRSPALSGCGSRRGFSAAAALNTAVSDSPARKTPFKPSIRALERSLLTRGVREYCPMEPERRQGSICNYSSHRRGRLPGGVGLSSARSQAALALRLVARGELSALATPSCSGSCCYTKEALSDQAACRRSWVSNQ